MLKWYFLYFSLCPLHFVLSLDRLLTSLCLLQTFPRVSEMGDFWRQIILVKSKEKKVLSTLDMLVVTRSSAPFGNWPTSSLVFLLLLLYLQRSFLLPFKSFTRFNYKLAFLILILNSLKKSLYLSWVACSCFQLTYASYLYSSFVRSSLFITGVPATFARLCSKRLASLEHGKGLSLKINWHFSSLQQ